jgi:hypothetical protein
VIRQLRITHQGAIEMVCAIGSCWNSDSDRILPPQYGTPPKVGIAKQWIK